MCRKNRKMFHCLNVETAANWITIGLQNKYVLKGMFTKITLCYGSHKGHFLEKEVPLPVFGTGNLICYQLSYDF